MNSLVVVLFCTCVQVSRADEGMYFCLAVLSGVNQYTISSLQPPSRTSLPISLHVHDQGESDLKYHVCRHLKGHLKQLSAGHWVEKMRFVACCFLK